MAKKKKTGSKSSSGSRRSAASDRLRTENPGSILILYGAETYLLTEYLTRLRDALEAVHGDVDIVRFDGTATEISAVLDEARSYGLMQSYKIVLVDDADVLLKNENYRKAMEHYAQSPADSACLVLRASTWNKGKLDAMVLKVGQIVKCDSPSIARATSFVRQRCAKRYGCEISPAAAALLVERIGTSLSRLDAELARVSLMGEPGRDVDVAVIRENVGLSREEKAWEIQSVLLTGNPVAVVQKLRELMVVSRQDAVPIFWSIVDLIRKLRFAMALRQDGLTDAEIAKSLRLWGDAKNAILGATKRVRPGNLNQLMQDAIAAIERGRRGLGTSEHAVEMLALRFVHEFHPLDR
ncbi:MAG: DNA polymerase III subunit delta [Planctomycetes bacterium]|nr:DNA polymerase III subunit delta [Planctomycetota bacterium]